MKELEVIAEVAIKELERLPFTVVRNEHPENIDDYSMTQGKAFINNPSRNSDPKDMQVEIERAIRDEILHEFINGLNEPNIHKHVADDIDFVDMERTRKVAENIMNDAIDHDYIILSPVTLSIIQSYPPEGLDVKYVQSEGDKIRVGTIVNVGEFKNEKDNTSVYCSITNETGYLAFDDGDIIFNIGEPSVLHGESGKERQLRVPYTIYANKRLSNDDEEDMDIAILR